MIIIHCAAQNIMLKLALIIGSLALSILGQGVTYISLQKTLFIPAGGYSAINITNGLYDLEENTMYGQIYLNIQNRNQYSNAQFDVFFLNVSNNSYGPSLNCLENNIGNVTLQYKQNQACNMIDCPGFISYGPQINFEMNLNASNASSLKNVCYFIDNTLIPCETGSYYPQLELLETIAIVLQPNYKIFDALKITLLVMIQVLVIMCAWNVVLYNKYKSCKKKLNKLKQKTKQKEFISKNIGDMKRSGLGGLRPQSLQQQKFRRANTTVEETKDNDQGEFYLKAESRELM